MAFIFESQNLDLKNQYQNLSYSSLVSEHGPAEKLAPSEQQENPYENVSQNTYLFV